MPVDPPPSMQSLLLLPWDASVRAALDALPVVAFTAGADGTLSWISHRCYELTGVDPAEGIAAAWPAVIHPDDREAVLGRWQRAFATGERYEATLRARMRDGAYRWFLASAELAREAGRAGAAWFGTAIEVTARRTAELAIEASEREYRALADAMPQIVWASTGERNDYLNAQWYRYSGSDPSEASQAGWSAALHPDDVAPVLARWKRSVATNEPFEIEHRLRRADGVYRWFLGRGTPFVDENETVVKWFGTCTDIDDRRRRERAERFVFDAVVLLAKARDTTEMYKLVTVRAVESVATYCVVDLLRDNGRLERVAWTHADSTRENELAEIVNYTPQLDRAESPVARALGRDRATFVPVFDDAWARRTAVNDDHYRFLRHLRTASLITVPLEAYGRDIGAITFCFADTDERYNEVDVAAFGDVGRRIGTAIENARASQHDRTVASRFQRAALPKTLPSIEGLTLDAVYQTAAGDAGVGGDWYDAVATDDGYVALSIGDVAGHDLESAVGMIGARQAIRTGTLFGHTPHDVLQTVNAAMAGEVAGRYVTAFVASLELATGRLRYASAGHPPALLRRADGHVEALVSRAPPLGLFGNGERYVEDAITLRPGDVLVLYTDGLIESQRDVVAGEEALAETIAAEAFAHTPSPAVYLRDRMLHAPGRDDVAILVVGFARPERWAFEAADAVSAQGARVAFSRYIARTCTADADVVACELIFGELIGNVVRHAPGSLEIVLEWRDDRAVLHVYDRGPGLTWSAPALPDTFAEGGRGLYIVAQLAHALQVEPAAGRGTHVAVTLPVERRAAGGGAQEPGTAPG